MRVGLEALGGLDGVFALTNGEGICWHLPNSDCSNKSAIRAVVDNGWQSTSIARASLASSDAANPGLVRDVIDSLRRKWRGGGSTFCRQ